MTEGETRRKLIDASLHLAGWNVRDNSQVIQELDIHLADVGMPVPLDPANPLAGHQFADYALLLHGKPWAVVEAKRMSVDAAFPVSRMSVKMEGAQRVLNRPPELVPLHDPRDTPNENRIAYHGFQKEKSASRGASLRQ